MPRVIHFEIQAESPEQAIAFYRKMFGWESQKWDGPMPYWLLTTGADPAPGINGGLLMRQGPRPTEGQSVNAFVCTVDVESLADSLKTATANGATICVPTMAIPGVGWLAYCVDPAGNIFGMMQGDPNAK